MIGCRHLIVPPVALVILHHSSRRGCHQKHQNRAPGTR